MIDGTFPPFAATGWALMVGSAMLWPLLVMGLAMAWLAASKRRPRLAISLVVSVLAGPVFAFALWISINLFDYGGGVRDGFVATITDRAAMFIAIASVSVIVGSGIFFLFRLLVSKRQRLRL